MAIPLPSSAPVDATCAAGVRGVLVVVGGHSRNVGKTKVVEQLLAERREEPWVAVKISAHRHAREGTTAPLIGESVDADRKTQTGRYLLAGARRAFLARAPDAALGQAAAFIEALRTAGWNVVVESNRIVAHVVPTAVVFVIDPCNADWKPSSNACLAMADAVVYRDRSGIAPLRRRQLHPAMRISPRLPPLPPLKSLIAALALICSLVSSSVAASPRTPAALFEDDCKSCHTIGGGPAVGPDLKGVTARQTREWLTRFILDPQKVIDSGDPYAKELVAAADGFVMPPVDDPLTPEFINHLLDYIEAQGGGPAAAAVESAASVRPFTEADIVRGRAHFTGAIPLSARGPACIACHNIGNLASFGGGGLGPDLTNVYTRLKGRRGMAGWLSSPPTPTMRAVYGAHKFTAEENDSLIALFEHANASTATRAARVPFMAAGVGGAAVCMAVMMWIWRGRFRSVRRPHDNRRAAGGTR